MLASQYRLKKRKDFDLVKLDGRLVHRIWYTVCIYDRDDGGVPRFGFVISTKISKLATQRNRLKRLLEETCRYNLKKVPAGFDVVFLAKASIANVLSDDLQRDVNEFFEHTRFK